MSWVIIKYFVVLLHLATKGVFIVAAKRTPFGTYGGKLMKYTATDLQEIAFKAALDAGKVDPACISSVVCGNVFQVSILHINSKLILHCFVFHLGLRVLPFLYYSCRHQKMAPIRPGMPLSELVFQ